MNYRVKVYGKEYVEVATLKDASIAVRKTIGQTMGATQWYNSAKNVGCVYKGKRKIAHISYNGRVWDKNKNEIEV